MKLFRLISALTAAILVSSCAGDYNPATGKPTGIAKSQESLAQKLEGMVGMRPDSIKPSQAPGLMEAKWGNNFAYVTEDGRYIVFGDMVNVDTQEQITEVARRDLRKDLLKDLGPENTIEFAPESPKYTVTVFTDVDCGYCRMLHRQVADYNAQGIAIRYVFYPRSGPDTESFHKAEAVWCSEDRKAALTHAKATGEISGPTDCVNPVRRDWELGQKIGLRGTPMIVLPNGDSVAGYVPPPELLAKLDAMGSSHQVGRR